VSDAFPQREDVNVTAKDLLALPRDVEITESGVRNNITVSLLYLEAWLRGNGCVPIYNLMEDLATAEISRSQRPSSLRSHSLAPLLCACTCIFDSYLVSVPVRARFWLSDAPRSLPVDPAQSEAV
jgi:hypothetical protein